MMLVLIGLGAVSWCGESERETWGSCMSAADRSQLRQDAMMLRRTNPRWGPVINRSFSPAADCQRVAGLSGSNMGSRPNTNTSSMEAGSYVLGESARLSRSLVRLLRGTAVAHTLPSYSAPVITKNISLRGSCLTARGCFAFLTRRRGNLVMADGSDGCPRLDDCGARDIGEAHLSLLSRNWKQGGTACMHLAGPGGRHAAWWGALGGQTGA